jgi:transcription initiation factor TFIIIB Brf1 subunit/transcription initiation factor TFIIB
MNYRCPYCGKLCKVHDFGNGYVAVCKDCKEVVYNSKELPVAEKFDDKEEP